MTLRKVTHGLSLALIILGCLACLSIIGCNSDSTPDPATVAVMANELDAFSPQEIEVDQGTVVTWTNVDSDDHTVIVDPLDPVAGGPNSDTALGHNIAPDGTYSWTVPDVPVGTKFYYHCRLHGTPGDGTNYGTGMVGLITVH